MLDVNIFLLLFGFIGALLAMGGITWRPQPNPPIPQLRPWQRVTRVGRVAGACLVIALGLGATKEMLIDERASEAALREDQLKQQVAALRELADSTDQTLKATQNDLGEAAERAVQLRQQVDVLRELADSTDRTLRATQNELTAARSEIEHQTQEMRQAEEKRRAEEAARSAAETAAFGPARKNIFWAVNEGGRNTYDEARRNGKSRYEAALKAQGHNGDAQETIRSYGMSRTVQYTGQLGR